MATLKQPLDALHESTELCPDCKRKKARNAEDCANGDCDKWYAVRDKESQEECARIALLEAGV